jgi:hypothetical protein
MHEPNDGRGSGTVTLNRIVWASISVVSIIILGGAGFFATNSWSDLKDGVAQNTQGRELRNERVALLEGRMAAIEGSNSMALQSLKTSVDRIESWQNEVRQDIADIKAALKSWKPP